MYKAIEQEEIFIINKQYKKEYCKALANKLTIHFEFTKFLLPNQRYVLIIQRLYQNPSNHYEIILD